MIIGKCPFCNGNIIEKKIQIMNTKLKKYVCSNNIVEYDEIEERFITSEKATCNFKIFSNCLLKYNKRTLSKKEIQKIINNEECIVRLYSKKLLNQKTNKYGSEYFKYAIVNKEYGVSILWNEEVEN